MRTFSVAAASILIACAHPVRTTTTDVRTSAAGTEIVSQSRMIDGATIESLRKEWETEFVEASATAPYVSKYEGQTERNRGLTVAAAKALGLQALLEKVSSVQVTGTTSVADLMASTLTQTRVRGAVQGAEVVSEGWTSGNQQYAITLRMPKIVLLRIIEESRR